MKTTLQLILIGLVIMCFSSCYTQKKAMEQVLKADAKYPQIVATLARDKYPCTDLLKPDTIVTYEDSLVFIECPDSLYNTNDYGGIITDTLWQPSPTRTIRVPARVLVPSKVITNWYEDSAKIKLAYLAIAKLQDENSKLLISNETLQGKLATRTKYLLWLLALCIGLTVWSLRKLFI